MFTPITARLFSAYQVYQACIFFTELQLPGMIWFVCLPIYFLYPLIEYCLHTGMEPIPKILVPGQRCRGKCSCQSRILEIYINLTHYNLRYVITFDFDEKKTRIMTKQKYFHMTERQQNTKDDSVWLLSYLSGYNMGFPGGPVVKKSACNTGKAGSISGWGRSPGGGKWLPTPVFLPGKSHGQRSLVGYSPWSCKDLDTTEWLSMHTCTHWIQYWLRVNRFPIYLAHRILPSCQHNYQLCCSIQTFTNCALLTKMIEKIKN